MLVTTFSAGLILGTVSALDLGWQTQPARTNTLASPPPDLGWTIAPKGVGA
ncbi:MULTISPECIES: hypothetical protein [Streptomyces]|uniref:Uncharacterized protein n=1 Tax=Streptomyces huasconensis TaxID=1854574 RepID=A0ABV3LTG9_9ACTN|nr:MULTISPECIES: hypothetical protein [Streptomyces]UFQ17014.1 hypothetical protein J2N69_19525 [Streptomyces huasconensis]WCL86614.1 hypothetical protein PPN52_19530 [Streptomyces sp. JCM 35825]